MVVDGFPGSGPAAGRGQGWLQLDVAKVVEVRDEMPVDLVADLVAQLFESRLALTCHDEGGEPAAVAAGEVDTALVAPPQDDALALVLLRHRFRQARCLPHEPRHIVRVPLWIDGYPGNAGNPFACVQVRLSEHRLTEREIPKITELCPASRT